MKSLHSVLFFLPDELSETTAYNIVIGILCIVLVFSLVVLYRRLKYGSSFPFSFSNLEGIEGMPTTTPTTTDLDPAVVELQSQTAAVQTIYDKLTGAATDQKNRIDANSQALLKTMSDTPSQTNNITHANINTDDPSKTKIPSIDMS
jgi:hypothetical protein